MTRAGHHALAIGCDITERVQAKAMVAQTVSAFGRLDILVNNAALTGSSLDVRPFLEETDAHWREIIDVNLGGAFICTQEARFRWLSKAMAAASSRSRRWRNMQRKENATPYCAAKAGLDGLCKGAAIELAPHKFASILSRRVTSSPRQAPKSSTRSRRRAAAGSISAYAVGPAWPRG